MNFFRRPDYTSEATQFINQLKKDKPSLAAEQRAGRALLWDKNINLADAAETEEGRVAQQSYVYGSPAAPKPII
jgi:hypothetical protein